MDDEKFTYQYTGLTPSERKTAENIRDRYAEVSSEQGEKLERLRRLDRKATGVPLAVAVGTGIVGILAFGGGLAVCLEWENYIFGSMTAAIGLVAMIAAPWIHQKLFAYFRKKYSAEIVRLSEEVLKSV